VVHYSDYQGVAGPTAHLNGGNVDFGPVVPAWDFLYRNAMRIALTGNFKFAVYANADADFGVSMPSTALELTPTAASNRNSWWTPGVPMQIGLPEEIGASKKLGNYTLNLDYVLRVPEGAALGATSVNVVYTVIAS